MKCNYCNSVLQSLDTYIGSGSDKLFASSELFEKTLSSWENIPLIYHPNGTHPQAPGGFYEVVTDAEQAAKNLGGQLVGVVHNPRITRAGHTQLEASLDISCPKIDELFRLGKLGISTGFMCSRSGSKMLSPPLPNHVLLFPLSDKVSQGDGGAIVSNSKITNSEESTGPGNLVLPPKRPQTYNIENDIEEGPGNLVLRPRKYWDY